MDSKVGLTLLFFTFSLLMSFLHSLCRLIRKVAGSFCFWFIRLSLFVIYQTGFTDYFNSSKDKVQGEDCTLFCRKRECSPIISSAMNSFGIHSNAAHFKRHMPGLQASRIDIIMEFCVCALQSKLQMQINEFFSPLSPLHLNVISSVSFVS